MKKSILIAIITLIYLPVLAQKKEVKKPNIIWLMAEDMSLDLECYGMQAVKTPNLNKIASEGVRFDNSFVTSPICSPARSAMMVGTHQLKINAHNHRSNRGVPLDENYKPFTYWLREAGYTCVLGHHGVMGKGRKVDVNFKTQNLGPYDGKTQFGLFDKYDNFEKADEPFFAQIQLLASHRGDWWDDVRAKSKHPVNPSDVVLPKYMADDPVIRLDWAKYLDQIEYLDDEVGMIFQELEDKGMADNTIVIFIGDNGRCNIRGKGYLHDPGLRIPFIVYYPKELEGGQVRKDVVSSTDITATILDFAGVDIPDYMTGTPIFNKNFKRDYVYGARDYWDEIEDKSRAVSSDKWAYIRNDKPEVPYDAHQAYLEFYRPAVHVMRRLYKEGHLNDVQRPFFEPTKPKEELYDLENDPQQLYNLAENTEYNDILVKLRKRTLEYDKGMFPISNIFEPVNPAASAVKVLEWMKKSRPQKYQEMQEGVEVGLSAMKKEYVRSKE